MDQILRLDKSLAAWGSSDFENVLKQEIEQLDSAALPLQQALERGNYVSDSGFRAMLIGAREQPGAIRAKVGIFYAGIIAGCSCANDPTPVDEHAEYCVLDVRIDKRTAATEVKLLAE